MPEKKDSEIKGDGAKILLVDDDEFLLEMYETKFKERGFEIQTASDGKTAMQKIEDGFAPDAVLLDVVMPGIDGLELLGELKKKGMAPDATTIMLTNQGQDSDMEQAQKLGAACYIVKASAVPSEVVTRVATCMADSKK